MCSRAELRQSQERLASAVACLDNLTAVVVKWPPLPSKFRDVPDDMLKLVGKLH